MLLRLECGGIHATLQRFHKEWKAWLIRHDERFKLFEGLSCLAEFLPTLVISEVFGRFAQIEIRIEDEAFGSMDGVEQRHGQ